MGQHGRVSSQSLEEEVIGNALALLSPLLLFRLFGVRILLRLHVLHCSEEVDLRCVR